LDVPAFKDFVRRQSAKHFEGLRRATVGEVGVYYLDVPASSGGKISKPKRSDTMQWAGSANEISRQALGLSGNSISKSSLGH